MQYQAFLIKYAEIGTKGKNRYVFEDALVHDIRMKLKRATGSYSVMETAAFPSRWKAEERKSPTP